MKKKLAIILPIIIVVLAFMVWGATATGAWFLDQEKSVGNKIIAGSLDLKVNGADDPIPAKINATNIKPGAWDNVGNVTLSNAGTIPGKLTFKIDNIVNLENGILEPEANAGDVTAAVGELGPKIGLSLQENVSPWTRYTIMNGLADGATLTTEGRVLNPGESIQIVFYCVWTADGTADNMAQGDEVDFDITFQLEQIH